MGSLVKQEAKVRGFEQGLPFVIYFFQFAVALIIDPDVIVIRLADGINLENILLPQINGIADG